MKYLVCWKRFMVENDMWEKEEDLENVKELVNEFKERMNAKVRRQENLDRLEERDFKRGELPERYMAKILYRYRDNVRVVNNRLDSIIFFF